MEGQAAKILLHHFHIQLSTHKALQNSAFYITNIPSPKELEKRKTENHINLPVFSTIPGFFFSFLENNSLWIWEMALPHVVQLPDLTPRSLSELHTACILNEFHSFQLFHLYRLTSLGVLSILILSQIISYLHCNDSKPTNSSTSALTFL